jgi:hypothetical protein
MSANTPIPLAHLDMTVADGLSAAQVRGRFDALAVHTELVAAGYTSSEADVLVEGIVERLAELAA